MRPPERCALAAALLLACAACEDRGSSPRIIMLDGSSSVFPISQAMVEEFAIQRRGEARFAVGVSGTGSGFRRLCNGETDINNASRQINEDESEACGADGIDLVELQVAWDGLTVVAHPSNAWADCMTVDELRSLWEPSSTVERWRDIRADWPDRRLELYGPDTGSGTFDYFTAAVVGREGSSRSDYTASADDHMLVAGVSGDRGALGYFGYAYFEENRNKLRAVRIDAGRGCIAPSRETIADGSYAPLARPMYIYISRDALRRPEVESFVRFYLDNAGILVPEAGYIPLGPPAYAEMRLRLDS